MLLYWYLLRFILHILHMSVLSPICADQLLTLTQFWGAVEDLAILQSLWNTATAPPWQAARTTVSSKQEFIYLLIYTFVSLSVFLVASFDVFRPLLITSHCSLRSLANKLRLFVEYPYRAHRLCAGSRAPPRVLPGKPADVRRAMWHRRRRTVR